MFNFYFISITIFSKFIIISCSNIFRFNVSYFCDIIFFLTKLLTSGILFPIAVNAAVVAKPLILDVLFSISLILAL